MLEKLHFDEDDCIDILNAINAYLISYHHTRIVHPDAKFKPAEIKRAKDLKVLFNQIKNGGAFSPNYESAKHVVFALAITKQAFFPQMKLEEKVRWNRVESKMCLACIYATNSITNKVSFIDNLINHHTEQI